MKKLLQIRFVKAVTISILFFIQILGTAYAQEKQKACLAPMGALGDISEMQKQIIFNSLQESLSTQYVLASQKAFEAAQTQAFDELEYDECTEDQCFALIQQILQVDNLFLFNMTREGNFTQLSLTRVDLDSQRLVRTANCEDCNIKQLNNSVDELVLKIFDEDQISTAGTKIKQEPLPESEPTTEPEEKLDDSTESYTYKLRGIIGSGSSDKTEFNNMSLHFVWGKLGFGLSDFYMVSTSSAGHKYELHNQSLDFTYTYADDYSFSFGAGVIVDGEAKSSTLNLKSTAVSGYRVMGLMGTDLGKWEFLGGYQYSTFEYKNFTSTKNFNMSGGLMVFGIGVGF